MNEDDKIFLKRLVDTYGGDSILCIESNIKYEGDDTIYDLLYNKETSSTTIIPRPTDLGGIVLTLDMTTAEIEDMSVKFKEIVDLLVSIDLKPEHITHKLEYGEETSYARFETIDGDKITMFQPCFHYSIEHGDFMMLYEKNGKKLFSRVRDLFSSNGKNTIYTLIQPDGIKS